MIIVFAIISNILIQEQQGPYYHGIGRNAGTVGTVYNALVGYTCKFFPITISRHILDKL